MKKITIREIMSKRLITLHQKDTFDKVARIFESEPIHHIPIVGDHRELVGMVSYTDFERVRHGVTLFRNTDLEDYNFSLFQSLLIADVMTKEVLELQPDDDIELAYEVFAKNRFHSIPIVEKGKLAGIITPIDILHFFFQNESLWATSEQEK